MSTVTLSAAGELSVYDFFTKKYLPSHHNVVYRNNLLRYLYPDTKFAIGDVSAQLEDNVDLTAVGKILDAGWDDYRIVGASGSRKSGRCIYAPGGGDYFTRWFGGSNAHAINYGSNLTTECRTIERISVRMLVVADGEWATGDCHAKCSAKFAQKFAGGVERPMQFRMAFPEHSWIAKGTLAYSYEVSRSKYDIVVPTSSFKGNKVEPGEYTTEVVFGLVHLAEVRRVGLSYSVIQFLPWDAVEAELLPPTLAAAQHVNALMTSPLMLAEYLIAQPDVDCDAEDEGEDQYTPAIAKIAAADKYGQLSNHPWVVERIARLFRRRWLKMSTASSVRFNSSMTMPDEMLADDEVCIPGLADGEEVLVFPYPCRWKYDLRVWRNRALPQWQEYTGVIVGNQATMLKLSRDFDGDMLQWEVAAKFPAITGAIRNFGACAADNTQLKPTKRALTGTLGEIATLSMGNQTGLITHMIAKAWAIGREDMVNALVPELQSAVDMLKGAPAPNQGLLDSIGEAMKKQQVLWLAQYKDSEVGYKEYFAESRRKDTISRLVEVLRPHWVPFGVRSADLSTFQPLFPKPADSYLLRSEKRSQEYTQKLSQRHSPELRSEMLRNLREEYETLLDKCSPEQRFQAVAAFWHLSHRSNGSADTSGDRSRLSQTGLPFLVGLDTICERLGELHLGWFDIVGRNKSDFSDHVWAGETVHIVVEREPGYDHLRVTDWDDKLIGFISKASCPDLGVGDYIVSLTTQRNKSGAVGNWSKATILDRIERPYF